MLQSLGVSPSAETLYLVLAPLETASVAELSERNSATTDDVVPTLVELQKLGLARPAGNDQWQALPLLDVVHALRLQRVAELDAAAVAAESIQNRIIAATRTQPEDNITVLIGTEAIVEARDTICDAAVKEICAFDKPPYVQARPHATPENLTETSPEWRALERGASLRCVYHPGFDADRLAELALFADRGEKSRTAPVPMKLILADAEVALIPSMKSYEPGQELRASVVRHPLLVEALLWLFEAVWDQSVPIISSAGYNANDPRRQMLISLLMAGSTDNAIATQLGINVRSVRRWISELMDELGVTTRLQLGAALVRSDSLRSKPMSRWQEKGHARDSV
jgi:DNA-binding CsgD family transcriptional regulator